MRIDCPLFLQESSTGLREIPLKQPLNHVLSRRDQESIDTGGTYHLAFSSVTGRLNTPKARINALLGFGRTERMAATSLMP